MNLLILKSVCAICVFLLSWYIGVIPLKTASHNIKALGWCNSFASGVFLGTALLHLLPEAVTHFQELYTYDYPVIYLICITTYISFVALERLIMVRMAPVFLVLSLGIHSLLEGAAVGANSNALETITLFFAIFIHKGSESFSLTVNLHRFKLTPNTCRIFLAIFSLITPIGILLASILLQITTNNSSMTMAIVCFDAIAAGTFLHLGTNHLIECIHTHTADLDAHAKHGAGEKTKEMFALIMGVLLMALTAFA